jgi:hypothetical protein
MRRAIAHEIHEPALWGLPQALSRLLVPETNSRGLTDEVLAEWIGEID